jgi:protein SCO1/2
VKPTTQKLLLAALAIVSVGTTGLVLLKGALEQTKYDPQYHMHAHDHDHAGHHHGHGHAHGGQMSQLVTSGELPDNFGPAPAFNLVNQANEAVTLETYKGQAVIASFVFTRCFGPCPRISAEMQALQDQFAKSNLKDRVHLVSFSVDPTFDTPVVLTHYGQRFKADPAQWSFLTGSRADMWKMVTDGYKLALQDTPDDQVSPILHSTKLVLIDPQGQLRGYYDALNQESRELMLKHLNHLLTHDASQGGSAK